MLPLQQKGSTIEDRFSVKFNCMETVLNVDNLIPLVAAQSDSLSRQC